jgi:phosphoesterase RecJ-like protein
MGRAATLNEMFRAFSEAASVLLVTHLRPDGDALGSTFGMRAYLRSLGKRADVLLTDGMPHRYIRLYQGALTKVSRAEADGYELVAVLDCANVARLNIPSSLDVDYLRDRRTVNIDHHVYNNLDLPGNFVAPERSSASEIAASMLLENDAPIPPECATALLAGMMTDTGCFRFSNTTGTTLRTAGALLERGAVLERIANEVFFSKSYNCAAFEADLFNTRLKLACRGKFAYAYIDDALLKKHDFNLAEDEGIIDNLRALEGVVIALLIYRNAAGEFKLSFRSKNAAFPVGPLARRHGGGGHEMAAGATLSAASFEEVEKMVLGEVAELLGE